MISFENLHSKYKYGLSITQPLLEKILEKEYLKLGGQIIYDSELISFVDQGNIVESKLKIADEINNITSDFIVGCDGHSSSVRKISGINFVNIDPEKKLLIAEGHYSGAYTKDAVQMYYSAVDATSIVPLPDNRVRIGGVVSNNYTETDKNDLLQQKLKLINSDTSLFDCETLTFYSIQSGVAEKYVKGRVCVVGDAAHRTIPIGGQGLNCGILDAVNLSWKIQQNILEKSTRKSIESYDDERRNIAIEMIHTANFLSIFTEIRNSKLSYTLSQNLDKLGMRLSQIYTNYATGNLSNKSQAFELMTKFPSNILLDSELSILQYNVVCNKHDLELVKNKYSELNICVMADSNMLENNHILFIRPDFYIEQVICVL